MPTRQKQQVSGLEFLLYDRPLHPEFFDIYHDHRIVKPGYEARIWVTGISHVISFFGPQASMAEVIAGSAQSLPQRGRLLTLPIRGEKQHETGQCEGIGYMMNFQVETLSPRLYVKACKDIARQGADHGILVPFPQWARGALEPFVYIDYESKADQLHVLAFHAFVDELTLIKTQSIFELA